MTATFPFPTSSLPWTEIGEHMTNPKHREWRGPFTFICTADTQMGMWDHFDIELLKRNESHPDIAVKNERPNSDYETRMIQALVGKVNGMVPKPRFIVVCGDMVDAFPNEGALREEQYQSFRAAWKELDPEIKLVCVCGNHDIGNYPTKENLEMYRKQFGQDVFSFWFGGVKFVVLNSQYFHVPEALEDESRKQMDFIEEIRDEDAKHIVVFQHIPFFLRHPEEDKEYFNLDKDLRLSVLEKLRAAGVRYIFCGHYHRNAGGFYQEDVEQIVTSAVGAPLGKDPSGYRIVDVSEKRIEHEYKPIMEEDYENKET